MTDPDTLRMMRRMMRLVCAQGELRDRAAGISRQADKIAEVVSDLHEELDLLVQKAAALGRAAAELREVVDTNITGGPTCKTN